MSQLRTFAGMSLLALGSFSFGQNAAMIDKPLSPIAVLETEAYLKPPSEIESFVMAPRWQNVTLSNISPDRTRFLVVQGDGMPPLAALGKAHKNFGGLILDTGANRARTLTTGGAPDLQIVDDRTRKSWAIELPNGAEASAASWSPDGTMVAYLANFSDRSVLCVADATTGKSRIVNKQIGRASCRE